MNVCRGGCMLPMPPAFSLRPAQDSRTPTNIRPWTSGLAQSSNLAHGFYIYSGIERATTQHRSPAETLCKTEAFLVLQAKLSGSSGLPGSHSQVSIRANCLKQVCKFSEIRKLPLEEVPERLIVNRVVELNLRTFHNRSEQSGTAIGRGFFEVRITPLHIGAENLRDPVGRFEIRDGLVDVVRQVTAARAEPVQLGDFAVNPRLENRIHRKIRIGVGSDGPHFGAHRAMIADGHADHRAAIGGGSANLVGRFK